MTTNKTNREAIEMLEEGIVKLNEVRQNLADTDIGDELLQLTDDGIDAIVRTVAILKEENEE